MRIVLLVTLIETGVKQLSSSLVDSRNQVIQKDTGFRSPFHLEVTLGMQYGDLWRTNLKL
jgi:hypothetical protein